MGMQGGTLEIVHYIFHSKFQEMSCLNTNVSLMSLCTILAINLFKVFWVLLLESTRHQ